MSSTGKTGRIIIGLIVAVIGVGTVSSCTTPKAEGETVAAGEPPATTEYVAPEAPSTTESTLDPAGLERARNATWAVQHGEADSQALVVGLQGMSDAASVGDAVGVMTACVDLIPAAQAFGDHAPDTEAGREAKIASDLYVLAAEACATYDLELSITFMEQASPHLDRATALLAA